MALVYGIIALISLTMVGVCVAVDKKRDAWLLLLFVSVSICNLGYFMLSVSRDLSAALNSNRCAYAGSVFLPFFMLMMILRFCGIPKRKPLVVILLVIGFFILGITSTPGILRIYYSKVDIVIENGTTRLLREYGPLHKIYYVYLISYMLAMIGIVFYSMIRKKIHSHFHTVLLLCAVCCNIAIWLVEQLIPRGFEMLSISYILSEGFILAIYRSMQRQGYLNSKDAAFSYTIDVLMAVYLLIFANFVRIVTKETTPMLYIVSQVVILMIYIGILVYWGVSVYQRIVNPSIRRYLMALVGLMMFWMLLRTLRTTVFLHVYPIGQWCWYAYYIPMILIPQFCLFAAKYIGKPEEYRLPGTWYFMFIPSLILILGIVTNDIHQWAFRFYQGYEAGWDIYQRSFLYYAAVLWIVSCLVIMITIAIKGCHIPGMHKTIWPPIAMIGLGGGYTILYILNMDLFGFIEMTAALCFIVIGIWESCIKTGLVQSNTHYGELMKYSGLGVAIVDDDGNVHYKSEDARPLSKLQMKEAADQSLMIGHGVRVSSSEIRGGYTLWQEDLSELIRVLDELKEIREDLKDSNSVSMQNYQMDKQARILAETNRLHDELAKQTAPQIDLLNQWLQRISDTSDAAEKKELLRRIVVVGAYLKRRNNMFLISEQDPMLTIRARELELSFQEMIKNLQLVGIQCACLVQIGQELPADAAMKLFDFYEYVVENAWDGLHSLLARCFFREGKYHICIDVVSDRDLQKLQSAGIEVSTSDEGCYTVSCKI